VQLDIASLIVSALAFIAAGIAVYLALRQTKTSEATAKIEQSRRGEEIAQAERDKRADLTVAIMPTASNESPKIWVRNDGPAHASDVFVIFIRAHDGRPAPHIDWGRLRGELAPNDYLVARLGLTAHSTKRFSVRFGWRDGNGDHLRDSVLVL
jgi:hypothetical protein